MFELLIRRTLSVLVLLVISVAFVAFTPEEGEGESLGKLNLEKLDAYAEDAMQQWMVPGMALAIIKDDSIVFMKGYGVREYGSKDRVDENTVFAIASITKTFTSAAIAMLDDRGKLGWDDRVKEYLDDFELYNPYVSNEIRIRDILSHRSGLKTFSGDLIWYETDYSRDEVIERARHLEQAYGFRYEYGYSNICYLAAGEIVDEVSGSWDNFIQSELLVPLGMTRTSVNLEAMRREKNHASPHYVNLLDNETTIMPFMSWDNCAPAASMNSSAADMCKWVKFQLNMGENDGKQLISQENLWESRELHTSQAPDLGSSRFWPSRHFAGYGLGWEMYDYHGCKVIGHEGGTDGMLTRIFMVPEENLGVVMLSNSISAITTGLEYYILDQYFDGESYDWCNIYLRSVRSYMQHSESAWEEYVASADRSLEPSLKLQEYEGMYSCEMYGDVEVRKKGEGLVLDFLPSDRMIGDLEVFTADTFLLDLRDFPFLPDGTVVFETEDGAVRGLEIDIPNPDFDFTELDLKKVVK